MWHKAQSKEQNRSTATLNGEGGWASKICNRRGRREEPRDGGEDDVRQSGPRCLPRHLTYPQMSHSAKASFRNKSAGVAMPSADGRDKDQETLFLGLWEKPKINGL